MLIYGIVYCSLVLISTGMVISKHGEITTHDAIIRLGNLLLIVPILYVFFKSLI